MTYQETTEVIKSAIEGISYGNDNVNFFFPSYANRQESNYKTGYEMDENNVCIFQLQESSPITENNSLQYNAIGNKHQYIFTFLFSHYIAFNEGVAFEEDHIPIFSELEKSVLKFKSLFYMDKIEGVKLIASSPFTEIINIFSENYDAIMVNLTFEVEKENYC